MSSVGTFGCGVQSKKVKGMTKTDVKKLFHEMYSYSFMRIAVVKDYSIVSVRIFVGKCSKLTGILAEVDYMFERQTYYILERPDLALWN